MNTHQLFQLLNRPHITKREPLDVVIQTANGGIPHNRMVAVRDVGHGLDWTAGKLIVLPEEPLVVVRGLPHGMNTREFARQRLAALKDAHNELGLKYIAKAREQEWLDGFCEGVRQHVTACGEEVGR